MNYENRNDSTKTSNRRKAAQACAHRHLFHMMPPQGWTNDPNGFVYYNGMYHLFYQHNPYEAKFGLIHWGHAESADLVRWSPLPVALTPDQPYDARGCFSGSSIVHEGKLYIFYTGNGADGNQTQCLAVSDDGRRFHKYSGNPVIAAPPDGVKPNQFRDPCVFKRGDRFFMVVGAESDKQTGQAVVYVSETLTDWRYLSTIESPNLGYMWECPDLSFLGETAVLLLSPQGITNRPPFDSDHDSGYFVGRFDADTGEYTHGEFHKLDMGFDFYAPQTVYGPSGSCVMTAWMSTWATPAPTAACQWAGSMILPREPRLSGDRLCFRPVEGIQRYLKPVIAMDQVISGELLPLQAAVGKLHISAENKDFAIRLFCSADGREYTALSYSADTHAVTMDLSRSGDAPRDTRSAALVNVPETLTLDIYLDRSSVEVFINDGEHVMTARVFPHAGSDGIRFYGKAVFFSVALWEFEPNR